MASNFICLSQAYITTADQNPIFNKDFNFRVQLNTDFKNNVSSSIGLDYRPIKLISAGVTYNVNEKMSQQNNYITIFAGNSDTEDIGEVFLKVGYGQVKFQELNTANSNSYKLTGNQTLLSLGYQGKKKNIGAMFYGKTSLLDLKKLDIITSSLEHIYPEVEKFALNDPYYIFQFGAKISIYAKTFNIFLGTEYILNKNKDYFDSNNANIGISMNISSLFKHMKKAMNEQTEKVSQ